MIGITERGDAGLDHSWLKHEGPKIVITKSPHLLPIDKMDPKTTIIHCTITGMGGTIIEPYVLPPEKTLPVYHELSKTFHTVLRIDPIFPNYLDFAFNAIFGLIPGGRVRISFLDAYSHVRDRFKASGLTKSINWEGLHAPLQLRQEGLSKLKKYAPQIEVCGEPGMECTGCVSKKDVDFFGLASPNKLANIRHGCACLIEKTELLTNKKRCAHKCLYCYWYD
jgi:hypothetical protein